MGRLQRLVLRFAGEERAVAIEAESRSWVMRCPCGATQTVWDIGGVRYKAASVGRYHPTRCLACGRRYLARLERENSPGEH